MNTKICKAVLLTLVVSAALTGCKTTEPLYHYGDYQQTVYSYFKGNETSASEQIGVLEQAIEMAGTKGKAIAPGVHAHLGMLYFESGSPEQGSMHFEQEKALFPESTVYIDFLLKSARGE
jgi:hypothetical protein